MSLWKNNIRKIDPYVPGEQPQSANVIKLNTNESPFPPSPKAAAALKAFNTDIMRKYPSFVCPELKAALAKIYNVGENELFLGNGSDEVLALCFMTFFNSDKPVLFPDVTYSFYPVWCDLYNIPYKAVPLDDSFKIRKEDYYEPNGGIVIANPNAPTSIFMPLDELEDIIKHNQDSIVIIDEAYIDFGGESAIELIHKYDNLAVVQTYSKSRSLAGLRVGYAAMQPELLASLEAVKNSFNSYTLDTLAQLMATEAALDTDYLKKCTDTIKQNRAYTVAELDKLGFKTLPSSANFIFTTCPDKNAEEIFEYLKADSIYVRYFKKPRISEYLRITIGSEEEMSALIDSLKKYLSK